MENTELTLRLPSVDDAEEIRAYRREFLETGGSMDGTGPLRRFDDPAEWLRETEKYRIFTDFRVNGQRELTRNGLA